MSSFMIGSFYVNNTHFGKKSHPCCINEPIANHMQFISVNWVSILSWWELAVGHSYGVNLHANENIFQSELWGVDVHFSRLLTELK